MLGAVGDGWQVAMTTLLHERGTLGFALVRDARRRRAQARSRSRRSESVTDPVLRDRIAREWIELQALKYTNYRSLTDARRRPASRARRVGVEARLVGGRTSA